MTASREAILETINSYVSLVASGTADEILALYAAGATVEDPIGSEVRTTRESIHEFYAVLEDLQQDATLQVAKVGDGQAAFLFELVTKTDDATYTVAPIDVMTFDDDAKITSMRAFWSDEDFQVS
ncbi:nuclear transport factor 2 family protein [Nocardioides sp.]|uniref:nuclear transport factor 2 family protein n=1 Tax=Nocardioides sp. TaxID=35761 RepID=UPI00262B5729|nr:nuclear transport factor 2 family protein [Nocardioides sp.]